jgi:hypothetical protein
MYFMSPSSDERVEIETNLMRGHFSEEHIEWYIKEVQKDLITDLNVNRGVGDFRPMTNVEVEEYNKPMQPDYGEVENGKHPRFRH